MFGVENTIYAISACSSRLELSKAATNSDAVSRARRGLASGVYRREGRVDERDISLPL